MSEFNDEIWKRSIHTLFRPMIAFHFPTQGKRASRGRTEGHPERGMTENVKRVYTAVHRLIRQHNFRFRASE